ncbi:JNK-interacting protein 1 [Phlebotomus argentipes]|uniref:JNK-interacting protein 1 n=1 Tax=Phlebotomus argentipes TaxID=94469 RepID=UPI0028929D5C|nr:JNK-interacting protein 1 [Phlebotomus argentipes]
MADTEFEEFRQIFEHFPNHLKTPAQFYSLVPGLDDGEPSPSPKSDSSASDCEEGGADPRAATPHKSSADGGFLGQQIALSSGAEDDEIGDGLRTQTLQAPVLARTNSLPFMSGSTERRRRKLPEIPKNKKSSIMVMCSQTSLADELGMKTAGQRSVLALKCGYLLDEDSSPDSERLHSLGDVDSGHSTAHSPTDFKSMSPPPAGGTLYSRLELLEATHRALHKFLPRHHDEIELEIGDAVYVEKEADDLWCEGVNLRTGRHGIFPSAYAVDLEYNDFDPGAQQAKRERYLLGYLGSVETLAHKGTGVVCQAVRKILARSGDSPQAQPCILEVSDQGLRMLERARPPDRKGPHMDFFYSLKNVSFISFDPRDNRYIGFITKHPTVQRFACHVFRGHESTRPVAEAVGRAFQRFYQKFIETAYPIEDIYIE